MGIEKAFEGTFSPPYSETRPGSVLEPGGEKRVEGNA